MRSITLSRSNPRRTLAGPPIVVRSIALPRPAPLAASAGLGAGIPGRPCFPDAVDGAFAGVASSRPERVSSARCAAVERTDARAIARLYSAPAS